MSMELPDIDFSVPPFLIHHYYVSGTIAILMNSFVVYLLLFENRKMDSFRYYMLSFVLACSLVDFHVSFSMQPVPLFPIVTGQCAGFLAIQFNWSPHLLMTFMTLFLGFQVNILALCFFRKHQVIAVIGKRYVLSKAKSNAVVLFCLFYTFAYTIPFYCSRLSKEEQFRLIDQKYPQLRPQFEQLPNFDVYELNPSMMTFFLGIIGGCMQATVTISLLAFQMYTTLLRCQHNLSKTTLEKHKTALTSLVVQFLVTPIAILPSMLTLSTVFIVFDGVQVFTWYMMMIMTTHSTINCIVIIFTNPEFKSFVLFWSKAGQLRRNRSSFNTVHDISGSIRVL